MRYVILMVLALLTACAGQGQLEPVTVPNLAQGSSAANQAAALPLNAPNSGRVCETRKRPGSNIAETICYTREQQVAREDASKEALDRLENEQHWRDQAIQDALMRNQYPRGAGLGPR